MQKNRWMLACSLAVITGCAVDVSAALAADADQGSFSPAAATGATGDIVVTARRRAESLQKVPVSIQAFSDKALKEHAIYSSNDLDKSVPGMSVVASQTNPGIPEFAIRGRGLNYGAAAGSVETYFAEVPLSGPFQAQKLPPQFFDVQSFQVLKGPQGTLFGRSTTGGAVLVVPAAPTDKLEGSVRLQGGNYGDFQAEAMVNVPIQGDKLMLRVAAFDWQRQGYSHTYPGSIESLTGQTLPSQRFNNVDETELRATLLWKPTDTITNSTIVTYHTDNNRGGAGAGRYLGLVGGHLGVIPSPGAGTQWSYSDVLMKQARAQALGIINTTTVAVADGVTLKNIFGYIDTRGDTAQATNTDGTNRPTVSLPALPRLTKNKQYTDEVQLQGHALNNQLTWTVGGLIDLERQPGNINDINYQSIVFNPQDLARDYFLPCPNALNQVPGTTCSFLVSKFAQNTVSSKGLYASVSYKITSDLTLDAGFRHSWDSVSLKSGIGEGLVPQLPGATPPLTPDPASIATSHAAFQGNTWNLGLSYNVDRNSMVYGGWRRGYKRGGFNQSAPNPSVAAFSPETIDDLFAGVKTDFHLGDVPVRLNVEGFYDFYKNQQVSYYGFTATGLSAITVNVDRTQYRGFDIQLDADPAPWLKLNTSYSYLSAKIHKWRDLSLGVDGSGNPVSDLDLSVNPVNYAPKGKLTATARIHAELPGNAGEFAVAPTLSYSSSFISYANGVLLPAASQQICGNFNGLALGSDMVPAHTLVDLRVEWNRILGSKVNAALNVQNLTNKTYLVGNGATLFYGVEGDAYGAPRMITFEVSAKF